LFLRLLLDALVHASPRGVLPDSSFHVARTSGKQVTCWAWGNGDDGILVPLEHHLGITSVWIPELDSTILRARHDPFASRSKANRKHLVLVALKGADTFTVFRGRRRDEASLWCELPHLDGLV